MEPYLTTFVDAHDRQLLVRGATPFARGFERFQKGSSRESHRVLEWFYKGAYRVWPGHPFRQQPKHHPSVPSMTMSSYSASFLLLFVVP